MKLFLFFLLIFPSLIHAKSNEVNKLLTDLVTNNIKAEQLTDDQLCESLQHLDLISTFNEHNKRNIITPLCSFSSSNQDLRAK